MDFQKAILEAVDLGYEVTLRPGSPHLPDAIRVDLTWRGEWTDTKATSSGAISKLAIRDAKDPYMMAYCLKELIRRLRYETRGYGV